MAERFYGVDVGGDMPTDVTEAASTTSKVQEFRVTYTTAGLDKTKVLNALEAIRNYIIADTFPPA